MQLIAIGLAADGINERLPLYFLATVYRLGRFHTAN